MTMGQYQGSHPDGSGGRAPAPAGQPGGTGGRPHRRSTLYLVKQVELAIRARLDDIVRPAGLTALQYTALTALERRADMSSAQLARSSFVTAQSMADMIAILKARGLIVRHRDHVDRRRLVVSLTPAGLALLDEYQDAVRALEDGMLAGLSQEEVGALRAALGTCHANLSAMSRP
jgi:DNA-binding MarR family transcriptional regulator